MDKHFHKFGKFSLFSKNAEKTVRGGVLMGGKGNHEHEISIFPLSKFHPLHSMYCISKNYKIVILFTRLGKKADPLSC